MESQLSPIFLGINIQVQRRITRVKTLQIQPTLEGRYGSTPSHLSGVSTRFLILAPALETRFVHDVMSRDPDLNDTTVGVSKGDFEVRRANAHISR